MYRTLFETQESHHTKQIVKNLFVAAATGRDFSTVLDTKTKLKYTKKVSIEPANSTLIIRINTELKPSS